MGCLEVAHLSPVDYVLRTQAVQQQAAANVAEKSTTTGVSRWRNAIAFWMFVGPLMLGLVVFSYIPIIWGFILSLYKAQNTVTPQEFVGLQNYQDILSNPEYIQSLRTIALYAVGIVPLTFFVALGLAMLVNSVGFGQGLFRTIFFIPTACSYVVASLIWRMSLFSSLPSGFANNILWWLGEDPIVWIGTPDPPYHWVVLVTVRLWLQTGFYMIIFIAGLQEVPRVFYEAAEVDGAGWWAKFRHVTLPMLHNTSVSVLLLIVIAAFQAFDEFYNILGDSFAASGTQQLARTPLVYLYQVAFSSQNYGRGSAGAFVLVLIIMTVTVVQGRLFGFGRRSYD